MPNLIFAAAVISIVSCSRQSEKDSGAFDSAKPELKDTWLAVLQAQQAEDFVKATELLIRMDQMTTLTIEQKNSLISCRATMGQHLLKRFNANDPVAVQAMKDMKTNTVIQHKMGRGAPMLSK